MYSLLEKRENLLTIWSLSPIHSTHYQNVTLKTTTVCSILFCSKKVEESFLVAGFLKRIGKIYVNMKTMSTFFQGPVYNYQ